MNEWRRIWVATPLFHPNAFRPLKIAMCRPKNATEVANNSEVKIQSSKALFIKFDDVSGVQKPVFAEFAEWPIIYLSDRPSTFSPFVKNGIGGRGEDKSEADADLAGNNNNNNARKKEKKVVFDGKEKGSEGTAAAANKKGRKNNIKQKAKEVNMLVN